MHAFIRFLVFVPFGMTLLSGTAGYSQVPSATVSFDNRSGEPALVKLIGPSTRTVEVANGQTRTVSAAGGQYHIVARYGTGPDRYTYAKGDPFQVTQTPT